MTLMWASYIQWHDRIFDVYRIGSVSAKKNHLWKRLSRPTYLSLSVLSPIDNKKLRLFHWTPRVYDATVTRAPIYQQSIYNRVI